MRSKEDCPTTIATSPDPDLLPVAIDPSDTMTRPSRQQLPELPAMPSEARFVEELRTERLRRQPTGSTVEKAMADYFEATVAVCEDAKLSANWLTGDVAAMLNKHELAIEHCQVTAVQLGQLIQRIKDDTISGKIAKSLFKTLWEDGGDVDELIDKQGLKQVSDNDEIAAIVRQVIDANPAQVDQVRAGKTRVMGFLVGQAMQASDGKANPRRVSELLQEALSGDAS